MVADRSPPPAWGWTRYFCTGDGNDAVSPTRVGMDPPDIDDWRPLHCLPHPRGDGPSFSVNSLASSASPPPAWGWTRTCWLLTAPSGVSPTRVGMDPSRSAPRPIRASLPHPRGEGPAAIASFTDSDWSPPPAWGWTRRGRCAGTPGPVSPTRVGMDPFDFKLPPPTLGLPHPRGDGPFTIADGAADFVAGDAFNVTVAAGTGVSPTRVGMDPKFGASSSSAVCLPHPRGDGPPSQGASEPRRASPPPAWGWTPRAPASDQGNGVSPTRVGMDPRRPARSPTTSSLPHPRGDGPQTWATVATAVPSPPPAWGWTRASR